VENPVDLALASAGGRKPPQGPDDTSLTGYRMLAFHVAHRSYGVPADNAYAIVTKVFLAFAALPAKPESPSVWLFDATATASQEYLRSHSTKEPAPAVRRESLELRWLAVCRHYLRRGTWIFQQVLRETVRR
jgi:hypothetical protein